VNQSGRLVGVRYAKGVLRDFKWVEYTKWNAISRIEVHNEKGARYVVIDADATSAIMNGDPARWDQEQPTSPTPTHTGLPATGGFDLKKTRLSAAPPPAHVLCPRGGVSIIAAGAG